MARSANTPLTKKRSLAFVKKLVRERKVLSLTQAELAKRSGIPLDTVRAIEGKKIKVPGFFVAVDLIKALEGDLNDWI